MTRPPYYPSGAILISMDGIYCVVEREGWAAPFIVKEWYMGKWKIITMWENKERATDYLVTWLHLAYRDEPWRRP